MTVVKLLAIDASTIVCSAALWIDGQVLTRSVIAPQQHTTLLLPMIESLLQQAGIQLQQLNALAFGCGPGSFTGLRIAAGIIQGLAFAADLPVVPVSTLRAIAYAASQALKLSHIVAALDARMGEVYWGCYIYQGIEQCLQAMPDTLSVPSIIRLEANLPWVGVGDGWKLKQMPHVNDCYPDYLPQASAIVEIAKHDFLAGKAVNAMQAQPVYLRDNVVQNP